MRVVPSKQKKGREGTGQDAVNPHREERKTPIRGPFIKTYIE